MDKKRWTMWYQYCLSSWTSLSQTEKQWRTAMWLGQRPVKSQNLSQLLQRLKNQLAAQAEKRQQCHIKTSVRILVQKLVSRILNKAKVNSTFGNQETTVEQLFEKVWAEVKDLYFEITPENYKNHDKAIFKALCRKRGCAEALLANMTLENSLLDFYIVWSYKNHLMTPLKKHSAICRFFSTMGKVISKPFTAVKFGVT